MRAAIVTTLRGASPVLESFIRYHLALGFARLYLFFDDAGDAAIEIARKMQDARIAIRIRDATLAADWTRCVQHSYYAPHIAGEVMARQTLNVEVALENAQVDGIDWLLHIDADELFYCPGQNAGAHFARLAGAGVERAIYPNLEAIPETESIADFFREVTLFKVNRNLLPGSAFPPVQQALAARFAQFPPHFFLFYSNGKSAARVRPGVVPDGVHRFHAKRFPRAGQVAAPASAPSVERVIGDARILHFACCGYANFVDKYRTLGAFGDRWFGNVDIRRSIGDFHLGARDAVAAADDAVALDFYRRHAMLDDRDAIESLIAAGLLARIDGAAAWLNGTAAALP